MNLFNKKFHIQIEMCNLKLEKKKKKSGLQERFLLKD